MRRGTRGGRTLPLPQVPEVTLKIPRLQILAAVILAVSGCVSGAPVDKGGKSFTWYAVQTADSPSHIVISGGMRVRLLGVKAPPLLGEKGEPHPYRKVACEEFAEYMKGKKVALEAPGGKTDVYGALLARVYVHERDPRSLALAPRFLNAYVLEKGWARRDRSGRETEFDETLDKAEAHARARGLGIWKYDD